MRYRLRKIISVLTAAVMLICMLPACKTEQEQSKAEDIIVLYTNDVHCSIEENIGYAGLSAYKNSLLKKTPYVTLVDCGDAVQGKFIGTVSQGEYVVDIMNKVGYDIAALGNHEFDYGMQQLSSLIKKSNATYIGCNIVYNGSKTNALADVKPYEIKKYGDKSVAFIGVLTPETTDKSRPSNFMEDGKFVYDFMNDKDSQKLYDCVQGYVNECRQNGADYVVVVSHLGISEESEPFRSIDLVNATTGVDVVLDAHSHSTISCRIEKNKDGKEVIISSTGENLQNIGQLVITANGNISTGLISSYTIKDNEVEQFIEAIKSRYEKEVNDIVATSDIALSGYDSAGNRLVRNRETTIGDFCADAYRAVTGADIAFVNGGGIRSDLPAGNISYADMLNVHPFGNMLCVVETTGQEILDCLEVASMNTMNVTSKDGMWLGESGDFQQVSGLKYTIDTSVESSVVLDNGVFSSVAGERRVRDVYVLDKNGEYVPIDASKTYTLASHNYLIKGSGGMNMFADNKFIMDEGMLDYQVLITYIKDNLNGRLGEKYSSTDGRITIK